MAILLLSAFQLETVGDLCYMTTRQSPHDNIKEQVAVAAEAELRARCQMHSHKVPMHTCWRTLRAERGNRKDEI